MKISPKLTPLAVALCVVIFGFCAMCGAVNSMISGDDDPPSAAQDARPAAAVASAVLGSSTPAAALTSTPVPSKTAPSPKPVYYANCDAVRKAGKAPLRKGQPGYRTALDRDRDGVACEQTEGSTGGQPETQPKPASGNDPRYSTCKAAKAAGFGPYRRGIDPEYSWYRDGDGDGVVCE
ncbi:excalibur calcium-binding domain-containing protein [Catellatospora sp. NPDC049111]|uniref:excalibur calcium-binding domain-containing protein n=1 Tax=Catellatospora sp. NPDC049111 TaxID=3155271 RepID=UPI0033F8C204